MQKYKKKKKMYACKQKPACDRTVDLAQISLCDHFKTE